jgi:phosphoribosyl 1,2-cyclic phosphodiesterase
MKITFWGTRGSLPTPGPETTRYGGNTSCVEVRGVDGTLLVLDSGTGIQRLGATVGPETKRVDLCLSHLHMDHIQGLGFFDPLFRPGLEVHIWGPASTTLDLRARLSRVLSPPIFPVRLRDLPCRLGLHDVVPVGRFCVGALEVQASLVCHPGPTVGYRITENGVSLTYLSDHEPALGVESFPGEGEWTSGYDLSADADVLIHDAQYTDEEYPEHVGWGHSSVSQMLAFARLARVRALVPFHYDPTHSDSMLDSLFERARCSNDLPYEMIPAREGASLEVRHKGWPRA